MVATFAYGTRLNVPDYMVKGGNTYRFVVDHLGSVRMVVNVADGTVAQQIDYDEFGAVLSDTNPGFQPFGFAGGLYDADTGPVRFGARDYDAAIGRRTAKDPLLFGGGQANLYLYLNGDPVNGIDPSGLEGPEDPATCETCTDEKSRFHLLVASAGLALCPHSCSTDASDKADAAISIDENTHRRLIRSFDHASCVNQVHAAETSLPKLDPRAVTDALGCEKSRACQVPRDDRRCRA